MNGIDRRTFIAWAGQAGRGTRLAGRGFIPVEELFAREPGKQLPAAQKNKGVEKTAC